MKRQCIAGCVIGLSILLGACSDTPTAPADTSAADQKAIKDGETAWVSDYAAKDLDKVMAHYADAASLSVANMPVMTGKEAIRAGLKEMLADPNLALNFATDGVVTSKGGDLAYSEGKYTITMTNPKTKKPETEKGSYVTVYKKQTDNSWKAIEDINTPEAPAVSVAGAGKAARKAAPAAKKKRKK